MAQFKEWRRSKTLTEASRHAWRGLRLSVYQERALRWQYLALLLAVLLAIWLDLSFGQIAILLAVSALVLCLEMVNSALETLSNVIQPSYDGRVRNVKDVAAGAVLLASLMALVVGILLFVPALATLIY